MRVLVVHPGSEYSVADVERGYTKAFKQLGCDVATYNLNDRLVYYANCLVNGKRIPHEQIVEHAAFGLHGKLWEWWPDLIVVISGFYILPITWELLKFRTHHTALVLTECPYEDNKQVYLVQHADPDVVILNDPINKELYDSVHDNV